MTEPINPYLLPHHLVVFAPGAGGNFITQLLSNLITGTLNEDIGIKAQTGNAHGPRNDRLLVQNPFSRKIVIPEDLSGITAPVISWTHDFPSIFLFREKFPNAKVLAIMPKDDKDKLSITIMNVFKNLLDADARTPVPDELMKEIRKFWYARIEELLKRHLRASFTRTIMTDPRYLDVFRYIGIQQMMRFYNLFSIIEPNHSVPPSTVGDIWISNRPYDVDQYLNDETTILFYSDIFEANTLIQALTKTMGRELTQAERGYVSNQLSRYISAQNMKIILDPMRYYLTLKRISIALLKFDPGIQMLY